MKSKNMQIGYFQPVPFSRFFLKKLDCLAPTTEGHTLNKKDLSFSLLSRPNLSDTIMAPRFCRCRQVNFLKCRSVF